MGHHNAAPLNGSTQAPPHPADSVCRYHAERTNRASADIPLGYYQLHVDAPLQALVVSETSEAPNLRSP